MILYVLQALIRAQALQVLRELIKWEKNRFETYAELTILNVIQAHKDSNKEVINSASLIVQRYRNSKFSTEIQILHIAIFHSCEVASVLVTTIDIEINVYGHYIQRTILHLKPATPERTNTLNIIMKQVTSKSLKHLKQAPVCEN